jgi:hypothetical protein
MVPQPEHKHQSSHLRLHPHLLEDEVVPKDEVVDKFNKPLFLELVNLHQHTASSFHQLYSQWCNHKDRCRRISQR